MDVQRRHGENVARIKSNPEATPLQSFVASKKCWPKTKTVGKNNIVHCKLKISQIH